jgi:hypothetical protein
MNVENKKNVENSGLDVSNENALREEVYNNVHKLNYF